MKIIKYLFTILLLFFFIIPYAKANQGCCSWHGGISYCGDNGYYICADGTQSPSCKCQSIELTDTSCNYEGYVSKINSLISEKNSLEQEIAKLKEEKQDLKNSKNNYKALFWIITITFIIYFYYKNRKKERI